MNKIEIRIVKQASNEEIVKLYKEANWWKPEFSVNFIAPMIAGSYCFAGAFKGADMIGMGRAISDGISDAYIQDVTVLKDYRQQGIGTRIINAIVDYLIAHDIDWIGLIGEPNTESFYHKLHFQRLTDYIPMVLKHHNEQPEKIV